MKERTNTASSKNDKINLREILLRYCYHWKLFSLGIAIAITCAFIYLQFATYEYQVSSVILINDEDNDGGSTSEISAFEDLGLFQGPKTSLDTEMGILKSKALIERVVKELKLNIAYYTENKFTYKEVYKNDLPFNINLLVNNERFNQLDTIFSISAKSATQFDLFDSDDNLTLEGSFGESIPFDYGDLIVTPIDIDHIKKGEKVLIKINPLEDISINLKKRIEVSPDNINSNLLILKLQDPIKSKAIDILDNLVIYYNKDAIEYKKEIAKNTDEFVSNRIDDISVELKSLDQGVQSYKTKNNLSNLDSEASVVLASNAELSKRIVELTSQIKLIDYVTEYMNTNTEDLIPANLGLLNENTSQNTVNYNNLILERNRLSTSANAENPVIANLSNQIASLRESIDQSLLNTRSSLKISLNEAKLQEFGLTSLISSNPKKEREIRDIQRQQEIYETLYLYLLQKREENSISLAVTAPNAKLIDKAYGSRRPVAPRKIIVLLGSLLLGLLVPVSLITVGSILDNKIHTQEDIEAVIKAPFLGDIASVSTNEQFITFNQKKSKAAESFRLLRTNVNHYLANKTKKVYSKNDFFEDVEEASATDNIEEKTIFEPDFEKKKVDAKNLKMNRVGSKIASIIGITSTIRNEGKTFVALNLATALALLQKKVLLIEADLRNPKVASYLKMEKSIGLVSYLTNPRFGFADVITQYEKTNVDILEAGDAPENPAELLANGRLDQLLKKCQQNYDYIIIDTPAIHFAADALVLSHLSDLFIYVIRANVLDEKMLHVPKKVYENNQLPNMTILLNGTNYQKRGFGSSYSYGNSEIKKSWLKRLLNWT